MDQCQLFKCACGMHMENTRLYGTGSVPAVQLCTQHANREYQFKRNWISASCSNVHAACRLRIPVCTELGQCQPSSCAHGMPMENISVNGTGSVPAVQLCMHHAYGEHPSVWNRFSANRKHLHCYHVVADLICRRQTRQTSVKNGIEHCPTRECRICSESNLRMTAAAQSLSAGTFDISTKRTLECNGTTSACSMHAPNHFPTPLLQPSSA